jgi:ATP-dependent RNA helicase DDX10/DBP4
MRAIHIQKDKSVFKLSEYPAEAYAASMGLPGAPQIKLLETAKKAKGRVGGEKDDSGPTIIHQRLASDSEGESGDEGSGSDNDSEDDEGSGSESEAGSEGEESEAGSESGSGSGSGSEDESAPVSTLLAPDHEHCG